MKLFSRDLYEDEFTQIYLNPNLQIIEDVYNSFIQMPEKEEVRFFAEISIEGVYDSEKLKEAAFKMIYEIYSRTKFLFYTHIYKTIKLIEALRSMYNEKNYLGWGAIGRSVIEHSAVFFYFVEKLKKENIGGTTFTISQLKKVENLLIKYTNGTSFDWDKLLDGEFENIQLKYQPEDKNHKPVHVHDAIRKLAKRSLLFKDLEIMYSAFCDIVHPNMASHMPFIELTNKNEGINKISLNVNEERSQFIMVLTLDTITLALGNIASLVKELSKYLDHWFNIFENKHPITIDIRN
ncbi:hypothetical protein HAU06_06680 [Bacillus toyonensis]|uniref:DUF5677 domain-containing protein n=1 Tax=Bacillus toyonensis TaxID=155322 RepID=UPI00163A7C0B|nr:DUF5677 domain-containing protein [Bacillus toyonensis]MBC2683852.1 hypothetical protein [Bacillus toyonensis]